MVYWRSVFRTTDGYYFGFSNIYIVLCILIERVSSQFLLKFVEKHEQSFVYFVVTRYCIDTLNKLSKTQDNRTSLRIVLQFVNISVKVLLIP